MVRNPRMLMMFGLLAATAGAMLGSRAMPTPHDADASVLALLPGLVGLGVLDAYVRPATVEPTPAPALHPLEGTRQPRGPRESRDELTRPTR